jgi:hypothetical protein
MRYFTTDAVVGKKTGSFLDRNGYITAKNKNGRWVQKSQIDAVYRCRMEPDLYIVLCEFSFHNFSGPISQLFISGWKSSTEIVNPDVRTEYATFWTRFYSNFQFPLKFPWDFQVARSLCKWCHEIIFETLTLQKRAS